MARCLDARASMPSGVRTLYRLTHTTDVHSVSVAVNQTV